MVPHCPPLTDAEGELPEGTVSAGQRVIHAPEQALEPLLATSLVNWYRVILLEPATSTVPWPLTVADATVALAAPGLLVPPPLDPLLALVAAAPPHAASVSSAAPPRMLRALVNGMSKGPPTG
jgi:hypothetical protein